MRRLAGLSLLVMLSAKAVAAPAVLDEEPVDGESSLHVGLIDGELELALQGASARFFGFAGVPADDQQRQLAVSGAALLRDAGTMFRLPPAAGCRVLEVVLGGAVLEAIGQAGTTAPGQALERLRERDVPLGGRPALERGGMPAAAPHADPSSTHGADVRAVYRYRCNRPDALDGIAVQVFTSFPATSPMRVSIDQGEAHEAFELSASAPLIELQGSER